MRLCALGLSDPVCVCVNLTSPLPSPRLGANEGSFAQAAGGAAGAAGSPTGSTSSEVTLGGASSAPASGWSDVAVAISSASGTSISCEAAALGSVKK